MKIGPIWVQFRDGGKIEKEPKSDQVSRDGHLAPSKNDAKLRIDILNHKGALAALTNVVARCGSNVHSLNSGEKESGLYLIDMEITCRNRVHLADIIRKIKVMGDVQRVVRNK